MFVRDVMTPSPATCSAYAPIRDVASLMVAHSCGEIPVCEGERVVGVITDRDITCRVVAAGRNPADLIARDVMTHLVVTIDSEETLDDAIDMMRLEKITRLPVTDKSGKLVGMLSHTDIAAVATPRKVQILERDIAQSRRREAREFVITL